ncbi:MAG: carboxymuconolactone decarboxylase family protein [Gammaproteobacteria bacterium]|jgi:4-carboxymuconolactone decarboxylase|nr:carboxymuconolactone decarboxylase family protein [Gammaproteobacteria bacterium]MBT4494828.1 carboxymuconolactone decarboxylase family protein [Gammaproteobacteria bacterium]MBT7370138.1 carboxymuconolactone decarboxylase family protein [Gammaproteobacteria bacterium]
MKLTTPRVPVLDEQEWSDEQREILEKQSTRGHIPNVFRTVIRHEKLAKRWLVFGAHIMAKSSLSPREREMAILRSGWLADSEYEWHQHAVIGQEEGLSPEEIEGIKTGADAGCWTDHEQFILRAADELHESSFISDEIWDGLSRTYSTNQMLDLIFTCGQYRMLAGALNSLGVQIED